FATSLNYTHTVFFMFLFFHHSFFFKIIGKVSCNALLLFSTGKTGCSRCSIVTGSLDCPRLNHTLKMIPPESSKYPIKKYRVYSRCFLMGNCCHCLSHLSMVLSIFFRSCFIALHF